MERHDPTTAHTERTTAGLRRAARDHAAKPHASSPTQRPPRRMRSLGISDAEIVYELSATSR